MARDGFCAGRHCTLRTFQDEVIQHFLQASHYEYSQKARNPIVQLSSQIHSASCLRHSDHEQRHYKIAVLGSMRAISYVCITASHPGVLQGQPLIIFYGVVRDRWEAQSTFRIQNTARSPRKNSAITHSISRAMHTGYCSINISGILTTFSSKTRRCRLSLAYGPGPSRLLLG